MTAHALPRLRARRRRWKPPPPALIFALMMVAISSFGLAIYILSVLSFGPDILDPPGMAFEGWILWHWWPILQREWRRWRDDD